MERFLAYFNLEQLWLALDLLLAAVLGFVIGLERKVREKEAGIRTHTIVAFGSALMMVISKYAFGAEADSARVAAQIVAGIGFLGAGIIVYKKNVVHGLTTAAGIWGDGRHRYGVWRRIVDRSRPCNGAFSAGAMVFT